MSGENWIRPSSRKFSLGVTPRALSRIDATSTPSLDVPQKATNRRFSLAATFFDAAKADRKTSLCVEKDYLNHQGRYRTVADPDLERPLFVERSEEKGVRTFRSDSIKPARSRRMGRAMRVVVVGGKKVGKTAILRQVACVEDVTNKPYEPTIEDTYQVLLEEPDKAREILILHDTAGVSNYGPIELKKAYVQAADAFVLVYSSADYESFNRVDLLKKWIDRQFGKDKKEVPIVVLANMRDRPATVDSAFAHSWAAREKVKLFEVTAKDRQSLVDFIHYVGHRHFHPTKESKFSLSKKLKSEKSSNPAILMDF
ncbi:NF-kappa-B inhibitor-interacting Ras-like protein [Caenorhabditis elegans]|uniref:NF-kappa-B inhibitor-interacting Ras-like protein n=1 Tax=Caenorhabditis elegans TaxID=6239 RepID=A0A1D3PCM1_CAEEL|nr:NF-kappa-B inhibitor-interacting Ras-like protein [Caenorhabditis elegans]SCN13871.1 NF-kappa-B inhibitor-interacting Ras-like protein [Caenorhabditis elegans]|eukprot:NP_001333545.1 NF-kappa-B inhibitor-interacting Ras-like protein [Caenorhabditis elegans]